MPLLTILMMVIQTVPALATGEVILAEARGASSFVTLSDWQKALDEIPPGQRRMMTRREHLDLLDLLVAERLADREALQDAAAKKTDDPDLAIRLLDFRRQTLLTAWLGTLHQEELKKGGSEDERTSRVAARLADDHASWLARHPVTTSGDSLSISEGSDFSSPGFLSQPLYHLSGSRDITGLDFAALLHNRGIQAEHLKKKGTVNRLLDRLLKEEVTCRIAEENGLARDPDVSLKLAAGERRLRREAWLKQKLPVIEISTAEVETCYRNHSREIGEPDQLEGSLIMVKEMTEAVQLKQQILAGASFAELARTHSLHATAAMSGKLPLLPDRNLPTPFDALSPLQPGQITEPLQATGGVYLLRLDDRHPGNVPTLSEISDLIRQDLTRRRTRQFRENMLFELKTKHGVKLYPDRIPTVTGPSTSR